jgi:cytochrome P450
MLTDPDLIPFEPPPQPLDGLSGLRVFLRNFIETFPRSTYKEETTRITRPLSDTLLVCDPALIQEMYVERTDVFGRDAMTRRALAPVIGETSLFLAEGAEWRWQRRAVAPIFRHETLFSFVPVFAEAAAGQVARWRNSPKHAPVEAGAAMTRTTLDVIVATMPGGAANLNVEDYGRALAQAFDAARWLSLFAMLSLPRWVPFPGWRRAIRASDYLHREMERIFAARRARPPSRPDLLDLLVAARDGETGRAMTGAELLTNLLTFINAGHETTAVALTWALWLVARDDAVQQRLFGEVEAVAGQAAIEATHLEGLALCRQVIQEAMRLYPPIAALARQTRIGTTLGEHRITPSTYVVVPIFALHRHVHLWENPNTFAPERFAPDAAKERSRYAYLPFGAGPRLCIGASFAMLEATVILATLVRAFRLRPVPGHRPKPVARVSLRPQGGMPLIIEPRWT